MLRQIVIVALLCVAVWCVVHVDAKGRKVRSDEDFAKPQDDHPMVRRQREEEEYIRGLREHHKMKEALPQPDTPSPDRDVMLAFHKAVTRPDSWWSIDTSRHVCTWPRVECRGNRVTEINLSHIPTLAVRIPKEIVDLPRLQMVNFHRTLLLDERDRVKFEGSSFGDLRDWLADRIGTIHGIEVDAVKELWQHWHEDVPEWPATGEDPCGGLWRGPWPGVRCDGNRVTRLAVSQSLKGTLDPVKHIFPRLTSVKELVLAHHRGLVGELPSEIGDMRALKRLDVSYCNFTGGVPDSWEKLQLQHIQLNGNPLTEPIPQWLLTKRTLSHAAQQRLHKVNEQLGVKTEEAYPVHTEL